MRIPTVVAIALSALASSAHAVQVVPTQYTMPNGTSGSFTYWDDTYTGAGCKVCSGTLLSGGLGDLTDGIVATTSWDVAEAPAGPGPYVGWNSDPTITFGFAGTVSIGSVTFWVDGSNSGGVAPPSSVVINGTTYSVTAPQGTAPFSFTVQGINFTGNSLPITIVRGSSFVFLSEVRFDTTAVPEASTAAMFGLGGLIVVTAAGRRRKHSTQKALTVS